MRKLFWVLIALFVTHLYGADKKDADKKTFEEAGKFSVGLPENGFQWKKFQDINSGDLTGAAYTCTKSKSNKTASLTILYQKAKTDKDKRSYVAGEYDSFKNGLEKNNSKIIEDTKPKLEDNIPDKVSYFLKIHNSDGSEFYFYTTKIFGKNTISIVVKASKATEAKEFMDKIVKSFKELD
jgi:hypothetical protein